MTKNFWTLGLLSFGAFVSLLHGQVNYIVTDLGTLGGRYSDAWGINDLGQVVGESGLAQGGFHAFLYSNGVMTDIDGSDAASSRAYAINNAGQVVGSNHSLSPLSSFVYDQGTLTYFKTSYPSAINSAGVVVGSNGWNQQTPSPAYTYQNGTLTNLGTAVGWVGSSAQGINSNGQIVGSVFDSLNQNQAAAFVNGTPVIIGALKPTDNFSVATAINDAGSIVGYSGTVVTTVSGGGTDYSFSYGPTHAFFYSSGSMQDVGTLGGSTSSAYAINNVGVAVGDSTIAGDTDTHAFSYVTGGTIVDLNSEIAANSGWDLVSARGINSSGQIVGWGTISGNSHAFLLTPEVSVPEPATSGVICAVIALLAATPLRRGIGRKS